MDLKIKLNEDLKNLFDKSQHFSSEEVKLTDLFFSKLQEYTNLTNSEKSNQKEHIENYKKFSEDIKKTSIRLTYILKHKINTHIEILDILKTKIKDELEQFKEYSKKNSNKENIKKIKDYEVSMNQYQTIFSNSIREDKAKIANLAQYEKSNKNLFDNGSLN